MSTISVPADLPDPNDDSIALRKAFGDISCDKNAVLEVLCHRNLEQRMKIRRMYENKYEDDLLQRLRSALHSNLEKAAVLWMCNPAERDAIIIKDALKGMGKDEMAIIEVLSSRSSSQLLDIRHAYNTLFKQSLEQDIVTKTSGDERKLLLAFIRQSRPEEWEADISIAEADAKNLFNAVRNKNNVDNAAIITILSTRSTVQLKAALDHYKSSHGHSFGKVLKELEGSFQLKLRAAAKCIVSPINYFAKALYLSMKRLGTDDSTLVRIVVTRAEIDMKDIKTQFASKYNKSLQQMISSDTHGHYKTFLLLLVGVQSHELQSGSFSHRLSFLRS